MSTLNLIAIGIIISATIVELIFVIYQAHDKNLVKDAKSNILLGVMYFVNDLFMNSIAFSVFSFAYQSSVFKPEISWQLWIIGFFACDFIHYVYHWLGHHTRIFWAPHVTHHSSPYFNLSHGYRINLIQGFYRFFFWTPLCFLGIPPIIVISVGLVTAIIQFLVHTEKVGKLGLLDWIFSTPSNHRVHHGTNPEYIDKNLGGILMLYDHLFGTYAKEVAPPIYGITHNIKTHDPYTITTHEYKRVMMEAGKIKGFTNKLRYLFSAPD